MEELKNDLALATVEIVDNDYGGSRFVVNGMNLIGQVTKVVYEHEGLGVPTVTFTLACDKVYIQTPLGRVAFRDGKSTDGVLHRFYREERNDDQE